MTAWTGAPMRRTTPAGPGARTSTTSSRGAPAARETDGGHTGPTTASSREAGRLPAPRGSPASQLRARDRQDVAGGGPDEPDLRSAGPRGPGGELHCRLLRESRLDARADDLRSLLRPRQSAP